MPTIASLINDFLAPEQPEYCREASHEILSRALAITGPVVHRGRVVSLGKNGSVDIDDSRPVEPIQAATETDAEGNLTEIPGRDPTDAELAEAWSLPAACDTPLPAEGAEPARPEPPSKHAKKRTRHADEPEGSPS